MDYLNKVLGIRTAQKDNTAKGLPNYIHARYRIEQVALDGKDAAFVYPRAELESVNAVKKHMDRVRMALGIPVVLALEHLTYRQKEYLLRDHIPFIVEGKQIYLPFMAVYLQERCDGERRELATMLPSAQLLLLYYIYHGCGELLTSDASQALSLTPTSISRASRQLEELALVQTEKRGVRKVIYSDKEPKELFAAAKVFFVNPVRRTVYVPKSEIKEELLVSGYSALSEYSMLNPPVVACLAADSIAAWDKAASGRLENSEDQYEVQLWRYDPKILSNGRCVDRLSLALALQDDGDERVEEAVEEMLAQAWRDMDGKRN